MGGALPGSATLGRLVLHGAGVTMTWSRGGLQLKAARRPWDGTMHPRDGAGRFIETGATVAISPIVGGGQAVVVSNAGGGYIMVNRNGQQMRVHRTYLRVLSRPDGQAPTAKPADVAHAPEAPHPAAAKSPVAGPLPAGGVPLAPHPVTGEQVAPVRDHTGAWHLVNPQLIPAPGGDHVAAWALARNGSVSPQRHLIPASAFDLSSAGKFPGTIRGPGKLPGAGGDPLTPWKPRFSDSQTGQMRAATSKLKFDPPSSLTAEEQKIVELMTRGRDFRSAYAEAFGVNADKLAFLERAAIVDVDEVAKATADPAKRRLYDEMVYLSWISAVQHKLAGRASRSRDTRAADAAKPQTKAAPAAPAAAPAASGVPGPALEEAALAGAYTAAAGLPVTACPYDPEGDPVERAQAVLFVRAYAQIHPATQAPAMAAATPPAKTPPPAGKAPTA